MPISPYSHSRNRNKSEAGNPRLYFLGLLFLLIAGGATFLATRDIPSQRHTIEKVISNERFFK